MRVMLGTGATRELWSFFEPLEVFQEGSIVFSQVVKKLVKQMAEAVAKKLTHLINCRNKMNK